MALLGSDEARQEISQKLESFYRAEIRKRFPQIDVSNALLVLREKGTFDLSIFRDGKIDRERLATALKEDVPKITPEMGIKVEGDITTAAEEFARKIETESARMNSVEDGPPEKTSLMEGEEGLGIEAEDEVSTETEVDGLLKQKAFWWTKRLFLGLLVTVGLAFLLGGPRRRCGTGWTCSISRLLRISINDCNVYFRDHGD